ncbi:ABC transporter substrate-binding protein [Oscillospiraceae bacterium]|nr:ABC transporter substrate-binding protein [Oscillospiraceae bacterium]BDF73582.1 ABC transporter substrate-binding protein [Oscillospiraceae bacterium]
MKKAHVPARIAATLLSFTLLAGCGPAATPGAADPASAQPGAQGEAPGAAKTTLTIGERQEIQGSIPYDLGTSTTSAFEKIYDALTERDASGAVIPSVAKSWEAESDTAWLFHLEEGIKFTDGEELNADAVCFTWEVLSTWDTGWGNINDLLTVIDSIEKVDDYTVRVNTIIPFGNLPLRMTMFRVLPPEYTKEVGVEGLREQPLGSGPYKYVEFSLGEHYSFTANPDHWRGEPAIKDITYVQIPDASARIMALEAGDVDLINDVPISQIEQLESKPGITVAAVPSTFTYFAQFNTYFNEALQDVRVRRALTMAVDVDQIIDKVFLGYAKKVNTPICSQAYDFYDPSIEREPYDPGAAKELLAEAGYADGLTLDLVINPDTYGLVDTAQIIAAQLAEIGVTINVVEKEAGIIRQQYATNEVGDIVITGTGGTQGDCGLVTSIAFSPEGRYSVWGDTQLEEMRIRCESCVNKDEQAGLYSQLQQMAKDQCPAIPLWQSYNVYAYNSALRGWEPHATSLTIMRDAYWAE